VISKGLACNIGRTTHCHSSGLSAIVWLFRDSSHSTSAITADGVGAGRAPDWNIGRCGLVGEMRMTPVQSGDGEQRSGASGIMESDPPRFSRSYTIDRESVDPFSHLTRVDPAWIWRPSTASELVRRGGKPKSRSIVHINRPSFSRALEAGIYKNWERAVLALYRSLPIKCGQDWNTQDSEPSTIQRNGRVSGTWCLCIQNPDGRLDSVPGYGVE
jgi:hypothetical protein